METKGHPKGFSLVEVMVALAILAIAISSLLVVRNNAIKDAKKAMEIHRMRKLLEQQMGKIASGLEKKTSGTFSESGYPNYTWRVSVKKTDPLSTRDANGQAHEISLEEVTLVVRNTLNDETVSLTGYFPVGRPEEEIK